MNKWRASKPAVLVAFAAVLAMPFYVGFVHWSAKEFALYALVASVAMATGEYLETPVKKRGGGRLFVQEVMLWLIAVLVAGGVAYLIAWVF